MQVNVPVPWILWIIKYDIFYINQLEFLWKAHIFVLHQRRMKEICRHRWVFAHSHTQCARRAPWMLALTCSSVMSPSTRLKESVSEYSIMNCLALSPIAWSGEWTVLSRWFKVSPLAVASDRARFNAQIYRYTTCKLSLCNSSLVAIQDPPMFWFLVSHVAMLDLLHNLHSDAPRRFLCSFFASARSFLRVSSARSPPVEPGRRSAPLLFLCSSGRPHRKNKAKTTRETWSRYDVASKHTYQRLVLFQILGLFLGLFHILRPVLYQRLALRLLLCHLSLDFQGEYEKRHSNTLGPPNTFAEPGQ